MLTVASIMTFAILENAKGSKESTNTWKEILLDYFSRFDHLVSQVQFCFKLLLF